MTTVTERRYTSRLLKAGAALDDTRRVVELWRPELAVDENLAQIADGNLLAKASRSRLDDILYWVIQMRYIEPGPHVLPALKGLLGDHRAFAEACYYETSRSDSLLADFAQGPLWKWWKEGRIGVTLGDTTAWLEHLAADGSAPDWTASVQTRAAQGLLSALRDFGVLRGAARSARKEIVPPSISPRGFAYVAWREHEQGASSRALVSSMVWRRWLLDPERVVDLFGQAARLGVLRFATAGSAVRVDWLVASLDEVTGAAA